MFKFNILLVLTFFTLHIPLSRAANIDKHYTWKNRLIITCDKSSNQSFSKNMKLVFNKDTKENAERKLIHLFSCLYKGKKLNDHESVLVGLDGDVKKAFKNSELHSMQQVYKVVDQMPMRINDIR